MKKMIVSALVLLMTVSGIAKTIASSDEKISAAAIDKVIRLVDKDNPGSSQKKVSIVLEDHGMSTDVSPRYTAYLGFASFAEMGNLSADFKISDQIYTFTSAARKSAGIYEIKFTEYRSEVGMIEVTQTIDATKMFSDDQKMRVQCDTGFCDGDLKTSVSVSEVFKKLN
jgi:hypothetical protein